MAEGRGEVSSDLLRELVCPFILIPLNMADCEVGISEVTCQGQFHEDVRGWPFLEPFFADAQAITRIIRA